MCSAILVIAFFGKKKGNIQKTGNIPTRDMYNTFNMGIGMAVIVPEKDVDKALEILKEQGEEAWVIGEVTSGNKEINLNI